MKRLAIGVLLAAAMAGVFLYTGVTRNTEYRRLVAAGDDALGHEQVFLALEAFSGAIALKSESMLAYLKRGETYHRRGDLAAALRDLTRASALAPEATRPLEQLGDVSQALGRHEEAAGHYAAYVARDDRAPRVLYKLALAHHRAGRTTRTIPLLRQLVELAPEMPEAHYLLGISLRDQDRLDAATEALSQVVTLSSGFTIAREALSGVFAAAGRLNEQVEQLEALAALETDRPERDVALELATERFPPDPSAFVELADLPEQEGDNGRARQLLIAHDALTANAPIGLRVARLTRIAELSFELGDPGDAVVRLEQALALGEPSARLLVRLADAEWRTSDRAAARSVIADGLAQHPTDRTLLAL